jgi:SAM-dependent MidA family methyltransferase
MEAALYGDGGFFVAGDVVSDRGPAAHFRTSAHATPAFAAALLRLIGRVDETLGRPDPLEVVDVGAGRGELLTALGHHAAHTAPELATRLRLTAVELAARPTGLPAAVQWRSTLPAPVTGVLLATEWLDNVPLEVAEVDGTGVVRYVLVEPATGAETLGDPVRMASGADGGSADAAWLARWWPLTGEPGGPLTGEPGGPLTGEPGGRLAGGPGGRRAGGPGGRRAEIGRTRDAAWAAAVSTVHRGLALCVDYGHLNEQGSAGSVGVGRPPYGTLTGFRAGRQVPPVPDGSCDITAHVALDSVAAAGRTAAAGRAGAAPVLLTQREALRALGAGGARPPLALASSDPTGYLRALAAASTAAELTDPAGLGGHYWVLQPVGVPARAVAGWIGGQQNALGEVGG